MLSNQLRILAALNPDEKEDLDYVRKAIEHGYEIEYTWHIEHIYDNVVTREECSEVQDILEMFTELERSFDTLADKSGIEETDVKFDGWDGNNEGKQLRFARHYCEDRPVFELLGDRAYNNSHFQTLARYRAMLAVWKPIFQNLKRDMGRSLTKDEIFEIVQAGGN